MQNAEGREQEFLGDLRCWGLTGQMNTQDGRLATWLPAGKNTTWQEVQGQGALVAKVSYPLRAHLLLQPMAGSLSPNLLMASAIL